MWPGHSTVGRALLRDCLIEVVYLTLAQLCPNSATLSSTVFQGKYAEAEPLYARIQAICEKALGSDDPIVATALSNRAGSLRKQVGAIQLSHHSHVEQISW